MKSLTGLRVLLLCGCLSVSVVKAQESDESNVRGANRPKPEFPPATLYRGGSGSVPAGAGSQIVPAKPREQLLMEQISSLRSASRSLSQGGFHREANDLSTKAAALEQTLIRLPVDTQSGSLAQEIHQLRHSVESLRGELQLLRQELKQLHQFRLEQSQNIDQAAQPAAGAHVHLRDRMPAVSDEQLDREQPARRLPGRTPAQATPSTDRAGARKEVEFELVPVPDLQDEEPAPTPVPTPVDSDEQDD